MAVDKMQDLFTPPGAPEKRIVNSLITEISVNDHHRHEENIEINLYLRPASDVVSLFFRMHLKYKSKTKT